MKPTTSFICGLTVAVAFVGSVLVAQTGTNPSTNPSGNKPSMQGTNPDTLEQPNRVKPGIVPAVSPSDRALSTLPPGMTPTPNITPAATSTPLASPTATPMGTPSA